MNEHAAVIGVGFGGDIIDNTQLAMNELLIELILQDIRYTWQLSDVMIPDEIRYEPS